MKRAALLRGVNLGGRKLPMTDLTAICERLGYRDARTLLASGNVVFDSDLPPDRIERELEAALADYGLVTDYWSAIIANWPRRSRPIPGPMRPPITPATCW